MLLKSAWPWQPCISFVLLFPGSMTVRTSFIKPSLSQGADLLPLSLTLEVLASAWDLPWIWEEVGRRIWDNIPHFSWNGLPVLCICLTAINLFWCKYWIFGAICGLTGRIGLCECWTIQGGKGNWEITGRVVEVFPSVYWERSSKLTLTTEIWGGYDSNLFWDVKLFLKMQKLLLA